MIDWERNNLGAGTWNKVIEKEGTQIQLSATLSLYWKSGESLPYLAISWTASVSTQTAVSSRSTNESGTLIGRDIAAITRDAWDKHIAPTIVACEARVLEAHGG